MSKTIPELNSAGTPTLSDVLAVDIRSTTVTITATTISATNAGNTFNDSGSGFSGFAAGDRVNITGFSNSANNIFAAILTNATASTLTVEGTDGDVIVDEAAGNSITISKWESYRVTPTQLFALQTIESTSFKQAVRVATTAAGTLASDFENGDTIDGVVLATNDRILIKDQAAGAENGIYIVNASGAPTRSTDADSSSEIAGLAVIVNEGTANADKLFQCTTNEPITVDTTALVFAEFSSGGGGGGSLDVQEGGSSVVAAATAFNFAAADFDVTDEGSNVAGIALANTVYMPRWSGVLLSRTTTQALSASTTTDVQWEVADDVGDWFDAGTDNTIVTIPAGVSRVNIAAGVDGASTTDQFVMTVKLNATVIFGDETDTAGTEAVSAAAFGISVSPGDTISVQVFSANARNLEPARTYLNVVAAEYNSNTIPSGPGFVERTYTDTLTISAAASGTWAIPANCININLQSTGASNTATANFQLSLRKESDGTLPDQGFADAYVEGAATIFSGTSGSNYIFNSGIVGSGTWGFSADILWPRDASKETYGKARLFINDSSDNAIFTHFKTVAPEDHDELVVGCTAGTITATVDITYTVLEAEVGYIQGFDTTSKTLTLAEVPGERTVDASSGAVAYTLPASSPLKTKVNITIVDGTNAVTVVPSSGERMNDIVDGTFTFTASTDFITATFTWAQTGASQYSWIAEGSGSVA